MRADGRNLADNRAAVDTLTTFSNQLKRRLLDLWICGTFEMNTIVVFSIWKTWTGFNKLGMFPFDEKSNFYLLLDKDFGQILSLDSMQYKNQKQRQLIIIIWFVSFWEMTDLKTHCGINGI